jgi:hypothetical protein
MVSCFKFQVVNQAGLHVKDRIPTMNGSGYDDGKYSTIVLIRQGALIVN